MTEILITILLLAGILAITTVNLIVSHRHMRAQRRTYDRFSQWAYDQFEETRSLIKSVDSLKSSSERNQERINAEQFRKQQR